MDRFPKDKNMFEKENLPYLLTLYPITLFYVFIMGGYIWTCYHTPNIGLWCVARCSLSLSTMCWWKPDRHLLVHLWMIFSRSQGFLTSNSFTIAMTRETFLFTYYCQNFFNTNLGKPGVEFCVQSLWAQLWYYKLIPGLRGTPCLNFVYFNPRATTSHWALFHVS